MGNLSNFVKRIRDVMRNDAGINGDAQRIEQIAWMLFLKVYDAKEDDWVWDESSYQSILPEPCRWRNWAHDENGKGMTGDTLLEFVNNTLFPTLKKLPVDASTPIKKAIVQTTFADANNYMKDGVLLRKVINYIDDIDFSEYKERHAFAEIYETILKELQSAGSAGEFYTPRAVTDFMAQMINPQIGEKMADFACGTGGFITSWLKALHKKVKTTEDEALYANSIYGIEKKQFPYILCITNMLLHDLDVPQVFHDNTLLRDVLDYTEDDQVDVILMNPPYGGSEKPEIKNHFPADLASSETADLFMSVIMYRLKENGRAAVILPDGFLFGTDNAKVAIKTKLFSEFNVHTIIRMPGSVFSPYTSITTNILFFDHLAVHLTLVGALREGEVAGLTPEDLDFEGADGTGTFRINKSMQRVQKASLAKTGKGCILQEFEDKREGSTTTLVLKKTKTASSNRTIFMTAVLKEELKHWLKRLEMDEAVEPERYRNSGMLLRLPNGLAVEPILIRKKFIKWQDEHPEFTRIVFHGLRHSSATYQLMISGGDVKAVQGTTGHASANLLVNTYAHIQQDSRKKLGKKFEEGFYKPGATLVQAAPVEAEPIISVSALLELLKDADPSVKAQLRLALLT